MKLVTAADVWYTQQQKTLDEIAEKLGVVAYRPSYHGAERDKNTVLFYLKEDEEHNREVDRQPVRYSRSEAKDRGVNVNSECVYIAENSTLEYSKVCEEWFPKVSWNAYKNDPQRNPPKTIDVEFVCDMDSERTEIWRRLDTGGYLMRKLCNEPFARWLVCRERQGWWEDGACVRPNITFRHRKQTEKVRYDDWNETAAYSDTFNPNFREG